ncbi:MAG: hypothetical protein DCC52_15625 [Chloroflexi bacterium]|nr:MAG: hypothetical protein DCC52_15625 [Chloroflexota bacterium]
MTRVNGYAFGGRIGPRRIFNLERAAIVPHNFIAANRLLGKGMGRGDGAQSNQKNNADKF